MSVRNLRYLLEPKSAAVIGASNRPHSVGQTVMRNMLTGGFAGTVMPVNPKYEAVAGVLAYPSVEALPMAPDLAVICTPPSTVPDIITGLGERGTKAAVVLTAGYDQDPAFAGKDARQIVLSAARQNMMRLLGPNCLGLLVSGIGLNASFAHTQPLPGRLAFVSQSGALATAVLDWAKAQGVGFSHFISLGNGWDVDFGDLLDYLGGDANTRAILLYIESVTEARKFLSAARAAARNKPVIVIKAGRGKDGAAAATSHTGALAGADEIYEAAIRRAGMLRVDRMEDLFNAAESLERIGRMRGDRLAIVTNGGGAGVIAADALEAGAGRLATIGDESMKRLDAALPASWSHGNPIDIIGDAPTERYAAAFEAIDDDKGIDAVLFAHAPSAIVPSTAIAEALVPVIKARQRPVFSCWLGGDAVAEARHLFASNGIAVYATPEDAVAAFQQLVNYDRNQAMLMETPPSMPEHFAPNQTAARLTIESAMAAGREELSEPEAKAILACYGIPVVETRIARDDAEAAKLAREVGYPVAVKVLSPEISHKSDVGGVALDIADEAELQATLAAMRERVAALRPDARIQGFTVQRMARRPQAFELIVGVKEDPVFGPVVLFGEGGTAVEVVADRSVELPPLNMSLAEKLVARTRVARLLAGYRDRAGADLATLHQTLVQISQLAADLPEVVELDINPLLADPEGVLALDARIRIKRSEKSGTDRLAIRPYPGELEETVQLNGAKILLRPIRPEDEPQHSAFLDALDPEDVRFRFFGMVRDFPHSQIARLTQIDFDREMAFIATAKGKDGAPETLGVVRAIADPDNQHAEFAIVVGSDLKGKGLGHQLLEKMIRYCKARGTGALVGEILPDNRRMLSLAKRLGFERAEDGAEEGVVQVRLPLQSQ